MLRPVVTAGKRVLRRFGRAQRALVRNAPAQRATVDRAVTATIEALEDRRLLSASISNGVLMITGTSAANNIVVRYVGGGTSEVRVKGLGPGLIFPTADFSKIAINGGGGGDDITLSDSNGVLAIPARVHGGPGNETVTGSSFGHDTLIGGNGIDMVQGSGTGNVIKGGSGPADTLIGGNADTIDNGPGDNLVSTNGGVSFNVQSSSPVPTLSLPSTISQLKVSTFYTGVNNPFITGYSPEQLRTGYGFGLISNPTTTDLGQGQTVVIVSAFDSTTVFNDLTVFSQQFGLPLPTPQTFEKVFANGQQPATNPDFNQETNLDVEWVHAIAPDAKIVLVEAPDNLSADIFNAVNVAGNLAANSPAGGGVVNMSFGITEPTGGTSANPVLGSADYIFDRIFENYPTVSFIASAGDTAGELSYPATSPYVTSVGGTTLNLTADGARTGAAESAWADTGGGTSAVEPAPVYQQTVLGLAATAFREGPDVAFDANPSTGVAVYNSSPDIAGDTGWAEIGGTSLSSPLFAATVALANQARNANNEPVIGNNLNNAIYEMNLANPGRDFDLGGSTAFTEKTGFGTPIPSNFIADLSLFGSQGSTPPLYSLDTNSTGIESSIVLYGSIITPIVGSGQASDDFVGRGGDSIATGPTTFTLQLEGTDSLGNTQSLSVACTITDLATGAFTGDLTGSALYTTPTLPTGDTTAIQFQGTVTNGPNGGVAVNGSFELVVINADGTVSTVGHEGIDGSGDGDVQGEFQSS